MMWLEFMGAQATVPVWALVVQAFVLGYLLTRRRPRRMPPEMAQTMLWVRGFAKPRARPVLITAEGRATVERSGDQEPPVAAGPLSYRDARRTLGEPPGVEVARLKAETRGRYHGFSDVA